MQCDINSCLTHTKESLSILVSDINVDINQTNTYKIQNTSISSIILIDNMNLKY